ncbi:uncharacterized protein PG998_004411 [Apiospora kogelbergensis]|uniref:uncharacterized protein n=1 Tax=Apiospora kogelbergensis TaxID=1337665 RepID=UPI00312F7FF0
MVPETERDGISDTFSSTVECDSILTPPTTSDFGSECDSTLTPPTTSDFGSECDSTLTPPTTSDFGSECDSSQLPTIVGDDAWGGYCSSAVPWPGNTYIIIDKESRRPLFRHHDDGVYFGMPEETSTAAARFHWLCVENNNHIGFQNPQSGCYLGHSGKDYAVASACLMKEWEYIIARPHPKGGVSATESALVAQVEAICRRRGWGWAGSADEWGHTIRVQAALRLHPPTRMPSLRHVS